MRVPKETVRNLNYVYWIAHVCVLSILNLLSREEGVAGRKWFCVIGLIMVVLLYKTVKKKCVRVSAPGTSIGISLFGRWLIGAYAFVLCGSVYFDLRTSRTVLDWIFVILIAVPVYAFWYSILERCYPLFHRFKFSQKFLSISSSLVIAAAVNLLPYFWRGSYHPLIFLLIVTIGCFLGLMVDQFKVDESRMARIEKGGS